MLGGADINSSVVVMAAQGDTVDLSGSWNTFWGALKSATGFGGMLELMGLVGMLIVVVAILSWAWKRRNSNGMGGGGGGGGGGIMNALIIGAILAAPGAILPLILELFDLVANAVLAVWNRVNPGG